MSLPAGARILDVGCGAGLFLPELARFGEVTGIEPEVDLLGPDTRMRERILTEPLGSDAYRELRFDLITALDVLEHIEDDAAAVGSLVSMLAAGGRLLVTVPAMMSLWDRHDVINQHRRRYEGPALRRLLEDHGAVVRFRFFYHGIAAVKRALAVWNRRRRRQVAQHGIPPAPLNELLRLYCLLEYRLSDAFPMPFGSSLLAVVKRGPA